MGVKKYVGPVAVFLFRLDGQKCRLESTNILVEILRITAFSVEMMSKFRLKWKLSSFSAKISVEYSREFPLQFLFDGLVSENFG